MREVESKYVFPTLHFLAITGMWYACILHLTERTYSTDAANGRDLNSDNKKNVKCIFSEWAFFFFFSFFSGKDDINFLWDQK